MDDTELVIKRVESSDIDAFWNLLVEQMNYDKKLHPFLEFKVTKDMIKQDVGSLSDSSKYFDGFIAIHRCKSSEKSMINGSNVIKSTVINQPVACVMISKYYSFFDGRVIVFSHLVVTEKFRGQKIGLKMIKKLCQLASDEDCFLEWFCSEINTSAVKFYEKLGSKIVYTTDMEGSNGGVHRFQLDRNAIKKVIGTSIS